MMKTQIPRYDLAPQRTFSLLRQCQLTSSSQPFSKSKPFPVFIKPINKGRQKKSFSNKHLLYWMKRPIFFNTDLLISFFGFRLEDKMLPTYWKLFFKDIFAEALTYKWICSTQLSFDLLHFFRTFSSNYIINFFWKQILNLTFSNFVFSH